MDDQSSDLDAIPMRTVFAVLAAALGLPLAVSMGVSWLLF